MSPGSMELDMIVIDCKMVLSRIRRKQRDDSGAAIIAAFKGSRAGSAVATITSGDRDTAQAQDPEAGSPNGSVRVPERRRYHDVGQNIPLEINDMPRWAL